jgi:hypothetical protein
MIPEFWAQLVRNKNKINHINFIFKTPFYQRLKYGVFRSDFQQVKFPP